MSPRSTAGLLALLLAGCDARSLVVGEGSPSGSFLPGDPTAQRPPVVPPSCPDAVGARLADSECWPTRHVGRWRGFVTGDARYRHLLAEPFEYTSGEVQLVIDAQGTGTLLFAAEAERAPVCAADGGAQLSPADAGASTADAGAGAVDGGASCESSVAAPDGARAGLLLGHPYALDALSMSGAAEDERREDPRVTFTVLIAAPWQGVCASAPMDRVDAPCSCNDGGCAVSADTIQAVLSLSRDGQALRGTLSSSADAELVAGLELVRQ